MTDAHLDIVQICARKLGKEQPTGTSGSHLCELLDYSKKKERTLRVRPGMSIKKVKRVAGLTMRAVCGEQGKYREGGKSRVKHVITPVGGVKHECTLVRPLGQMNTVQPMNVCNLMQVQLATECLKDGHNNAIGLRIPVKSNWNFPLINSLAESRSDWEVCIYLPYSWPLNRNEGPVEKSCFNHASANNS